MGYFVRKTKPDGEKDGKKEGQLSKIAQKHVTALIGVAIVGVSFFGFGYADYSPVDMWPMIFIGLAGSIICIFFYRKKLKENEDRFSGSEFLNILCVAFGLIWPSVTGVVMWTNGYLDSSAGKPYQLQVVGKGIDTFIGGANGSDPAKFPYVAVKSWHPEHQWEKVSVGHRFHKETKVNDYLDVTVMPGGLGFEWIADYKRVNTGK